MVKDALIEKFNQKLEQDSWRELEENLDFNTKFNAFHGRFQQIYESVFVVKRININQTPKKKWVTHGI